MENIRQALERAKGIHPVDTTGASADEKTPQFALRSSAATDLQEVTLNPVHLESMRIIAHDKSDVRSRSFDMLRTQVLQSMDVKEWRLLGITSPTAGCGKTVTAINLAMSIARHPERTVLLVDMDLRKPSVARTLGLNCDEGLVSLLQGESTLTSAIKRVRIGRTSFSVIPAEAAISSSSEWMTSQAMSELLNEIRRRFSSAVVILDLPPVLVSDDVIALLPQIDCAVLVASVGKSTVSEVKQCNRHLHATEVLRLVLNKVQDQGSNYYYYGRNS
jgi:capsular exopolysaccharide synthesis family protein